MFITWMRSIGGRLESRLRFSNTFTYNTFPMPEVNNRQRQSVIDAAAKIIAVREAHTGMPLAKMYDPVAMPDNLIEAHNTLDAVVDKIFGGTAMTTESGRQKILFQRYATLTGQETMI